jgi:hypothetical protein
MKKISNDFVAFIYFREYYKKYLSIKFSKKIKNHDINYI